MPILNLIPATHFKKIVTVATKDWKICKKWKKEKNLLGHRTVNEVKWQQVSNMIG